MKLTEKELNEFPIGTKIYNDDIVNLVKIRHNAFSNDEHEYTNYGIMGFNVFKVEIPTYTEYIPPKPILDDKEKEWLSMVIRPFRNKVKYIKKRKFRDGEFIDIETSDDDGATFLPYFKAGTMYKGMELDREYSLEDLGL